MDRLRYFGGLFDVSVVGGGIIGTEDSPRGVLEIPDLPLMPQALRERATILRIIPHLDHPNRTHKSKEVSV